VAALLVAQAAEIVDLDEPLHLASDRVPELRYEGSTIHPPDPNLWSGPG
jgi:L-Ala-D/L-Glu epimerase